MRQGIVPGILVVSVAADGMCYAVASYTMYDMRTVHVYSLCYVHRQEGITSCLHVPYMYASVPIVKQH